MKSDLSSFFFSMEIEFFIDDFDLNSLKSKFKLNIYNHGPWSSEKTADLVLFYLLPTPHGIATTSPSHLMLMLRQFEII